MPSPVRSKIIRERARAAEKRIGTHVTTALGKTKSRKLVTALSTLGKARENGWRPSYMVLADTQGVGYLRVEATALGARFLLNTGTRIDLVELDARTIRSRQLKEVPEASILEAARILAAPLTSGVIISKRAKVVLNKILEDKEIAGMAKNKNEPELEPLAGVKHYAIGQVVQYYEDGERAGYLASFPENGEVRIRPIGPKYATEVRDVKVKIENVVAVLDGKFAPKEILDVMASKKKATKKAAVAKKSTTTNGEKRGRAGKFAPEAKIKVLAKENPKRAGSASFKRFALYEKSATVAEFLKAGGTAGDLHYDSVHEYIKVAA